MFAHAIARSEILDELPGGRTAWPAQGDWRYADYLRLPEDGRRYEIIAGVLYVANAPSFDRQYTVYTLSRGEYALFGQYTVDELIASKMLEGLNLRNNKLFHG